MISKKAIFLFAFLLGSWPLPVFTADTPYLSHDIVVPIWVDTLNGASYPERKIAFGESGSATLISASNPLPIVFSSGDDGGGGSTDTSFLSRDINAPAWFDYLNGAAYPYIKLIFGESGSATHVSSSHPLPVTCISGCGSGGGVTDVTASSPLASSGGSTPNITCQLSSGSQAGCLSSSDWSVFNSKQASGNYLTALTSDVSASGPGSAAATVNSVGGSSATNLHSAELLANAATSANTASTIVKRDASGNFSAGTITASLSGIATNISGNLAFVQSPSPQPARALYVNQNRTDTYTQDGSILRPFKTIQAAINQVISNGDNDANDPYLIDIVGPGNYLENLSLNNAALGNLVFDGHQNVQIEPVSGNALDSSSNNDNLQTLTFIGMTFVNDVNLVGASNNTSFGAGAISFYNCIFNNIISTNSNTLELFEPTVSGNMTIENVAVTLLSGGNGQAPGSTDSIVTNGGGSTPVNWGGASIFLVERTNAGADLTCGAGSLCQFRQGVRGGYPGGTITCDGTCQAYSSFFRSDIAGAGSFSDRGSSFAGAISVSTYTDDGYYQKLRIGGADDAANASLVYKDGHLVSTQTTAPTASVQASAGTGSSCSVADATDTAGEVTITTGTVGLSTGSYCNINFNKTYTVAPICTLTPAGSTLSTSVYVTRTTSSIAINFAIAGGIGSTYVLNYQCIGTKPI